MRKFKPLVPISAITLLLLGVVACGIGSSQNQTVSVREIKELDLEVREDSPLFLSPNGQHIAWLGLSELCIYEVNQQITNCDSAKSISDELSLRWSPNSNYLTYTESFFSTGHDADIWIYDLQSSTTSNLTDDNFDANTFGENAMADVFPHWFANSQDLAFVRYYTNDDSNSLDILTINNSSEQINHVVELYSSFILPVQSIDTSGEKLIAFSQLCDYFDCNGTQQGIWVTETGDRNSVRRILWLPPNKADAMFQLQFSAGGDYLSACIFFVELSEGCEQIIVPVEGEDNDYLELPEGTNSVFWSPTTYAFLAIINDPEAPGLYYFPKPGKDGHLIQPGQYRSPVKSLIDGTTWASNNTIILLEGEGENTRYWLLSLNIE